jgi:hypothetical protein
VDSLILIRQSISLGQPDPGALSEGCEEFFVESFSVIEHSRISESKLVEELNVVDAIKQRKY